jgi:hypothetical protein
MTADRNFQVLSDKCNMILNLRQPIRYTIQEVLGRTNRLRSSIRHGTHRK